MAPRVGGSTHAFPMTGPCTAQCLRIKHDERIRTMLSALIALIVLLLLAGHLRGCLTLGMFGCLGIVLLVAVALLLLLTQVAVDPWQYADPGQYPQAWQ